MIPTTMSPRETQSRIRPVVTILLAGALLALALFIGGAAGGLRINMTSSEPLGLWRVLAVDRPPAVGDVVFICPPENDVIREARKRGYLRSGLCPGGVAPLIKTVIAAAGQHVAIGASVSVDGRVVPSSGLAQRDEKGRSLSPFQSGVVPQGQVVLHSSFAGSYDSRYFGPLPVSGMLGLAQEVLTYAP
ncbi:conjugative transfer signal peptidase TraF [Rhizobium sp. 007]|uniref:conjugative transfer signal peptidase TraF n=1 Tax=Rhizobium sp. 007 TaxID=2785056 RepID=UPI00188E551D|nr:conjugative transfer signal peptidase TraF [Rhizobium sp. 007]QPB24808.1 conjugative transfer signal peptidase TraF [Rhizobium sp. 007]